MIPTLAAACSIWEQFAKGQAAVFGTASGLSCQGLRNRAQVKDSHPSGVPKDLLCAQIHLILQPASHVRILPLGINPFGLYFFFYKNIYLFV